MLATRVLDTHRKQIMLLPVAEAVRLVEEVPAEVAEEEPEVEDFLLITLTVKNKATITDSSIIE